MLYKGFVALIRQKGDSEWAKSDSLLSLIDIKHESNGIHMGSMHPGAPQSYEMFFDAIEQKNLSGLPRDAQKAIQGIYNLSQAKQCSVEFKSNRLTNRKPILSKNDTLVLPEERTLRSHKVLYGTIERVGGATPKVILNTFAGNKLNATVDEVIAKKAATLLYQTVKVEANVTWTYGNKSEVYDSIEIKEVQPHKVNTNTDLFTDLKESLGNYSDQYGEMDPQEN